MRLLTEKQRKRKLLEVRDRMLVEGERALETLPSLSIGTEAHERAARAAGWLLTARDELRYEAEADEE